MTYPTRDYWFGFLESQFIFTELEANVRFF